jgi:cysteine desulfurase/selenocysteine lyase
VSRSFDVRAEFPILSRTVKGKPLVYLDSAATTHKPRRVIDAVAGFYAERYATVHRGVYGLSEEATAAYEAARARVAAFLGAAADEIVFTRGATEGINVVAQGLARRLAPGDEVLVTALEHHANLIPWQVAARERGARLVVAPVDDRGELLVDELERRLGPRTRVVAMTAASNALGTLTPVARVAAAARAAGALLVLDAAQAAPHLPLDVRALGCDFLVFSGHKIYGPSGIGVLYGRAASLAELPPAQVGGEMVSRVTYEDATYLPPPHRFEAGTPPIAGAIGLHAALDWLASLDLEAGRAHEAALLEHATREVVAVPGVRLVGTAREKAPILSFVVAGVHPHDVGAVLDRDGVCVRAGHHCAQPLLARLGHPATARASFALYSAHADVEALARGLRRVREVFG